MCLQMYIAKKLLTYNLTDSHDRNEVQKLQALITFVISFNLKIWKCYCTWSTCASIRFYFSFPAS